MDHARLTRQVAPQQRLLRGVAGPCRAGPRQRARQILHLPLHAAQQRGRARERERRTCRSRVAAGKVEGAEREVGGRARGRTPRVADPAEQPDGDRPGRCDWLSVLRAEQRRTGELDARLARILQHTSIKEEIAARVLAGRLTLHEAAARFHELHAEAPDFNWTAFRRIVPGRSDEERHCRLVIAYAQALADRPGEAEAIGARLGAELDYYLEGKEDGPVP